MRKQRNLPTFDQNVRTVYSNICTVYPSKNHVTTHPVDGFLRLKDVTNTCKRMRRGNYDRIISDANEKQIRNGIKHMESNFSN